MSLRVRLLAGTAVAVLCGLVVVGIITYTLVTRSLSSQVDDALQRAHTPTEQLAAGDPAGWSLIPQIAPGLFVAIIDADGTAVFTTPTREPGRGRLDIDLDTVDLRARNQTVPAGDGEQMRLRVDPLGNGSTLIVGQSLHEVDETTGRLVTALLAASAAAVAAVLVLAWWLVGLGLRPLRAVESSAAAITDEGLGAARVPGADRPTEVGRLARALNAMLDRLDQARAERETTMDELRSSEARMRQFVADASHELRTPVAATAAYAELFDHGARDHPSDLERSMTGIRNETARMGELVDDLLLLARLDEHRPLARETADLTEIVLTAVDAARAVEPEREIHLRISGVVSVEGDPARLRQVVDNLLANVRTHTPAEAACDIGLSVDGDDAVLTVADGGPGVTDAQLLRLGDRFYRVDEARTRAGGGSGLGLSIARAIVEAHGGTLTADQNRPSGLVMTVRLPDGRLAEEMTGDESGPFWSPSPQRNTSLS